MRRKKVHADLLLDKFSKIVLKLQLNRWNYEIIVNICPWAITVANKNMAHNTSSIFKTSV